jgi:hypothetical protein
MNTSEFIQTQNIETIWDVLLDEEGSFIMKNNGHYEQAIKSQFMTIIKNFYEHEKKSGLPLLEMNKKIVSILVNEWIPMLKTQEQKIRTPEVPQQKQQQPISESLTLVTAEEIQNNRKTQFEKELNLKRNEFQGAMAVKPPPMVDFKDKQDEPIGEMEKLIAETIAQRNFEINQIQNVSGNKLETEKWLQGDKVRSKPIPSSSSTQESNSGFKYIKIGEKLNDTTNVIELSNQKKQLTWEDNEPSSDFNSSPYERSTESIFKKLKPIIKPKIESNIELRIEPIDTTNKEMEKMNEKMDALLSRMDTLVDLLSKLQPKTE